MSGLEVVAFVTGLVGLFDASVNCFNYARAAKSLGRDWTDCQLKLEFLNDSYSRWAEGVGLGALASEEDKQKFFQNLQELLKTEERMKLVHKHMTAITSVLNQAEEAYRFSSKGPEVLDEVPANDDVEGLAKKFHKWTLDRQRRTHKLDKIKWALYQRNEFKDLLENVGGNIQNLWELVPKDKIGQINRAAEAELKNALSEDEVKQLRAFNERDDQSGDPPTMSSILASAINAAAKSYGMPERLAKNVKMGIGGEFYMGDQYGAGYKGPRYQNNTNIRAEDITGGMGSRIIIGDRYHVQDDSVARFRWLEGLSTRSDSKDLIDRERQNNE